MMWDVLRTGRGGVCRGVVVAMLGLASLLVFSEPALAQRRVSAANRVAKANAARKRQEIAQLQKQLDGARQLLDSVTTRGALTQAQLAAARQSAQMARDALHETEDQDNEAHKKLRSIEAGILETQSDDSDYAKALDEIHQSELALDQERHRILQRPAPDPEEDEAARLTDLARLTAEERATLDADPRYVEKRDALQLAIEKLHSVKIKLFRASDEWKTAQAESHRIEQEMARDERSVQGAANDGSDARKELRTAADIAASARSTIARAQSRLQALGAKEKTATPPKKKKQGTGNSNL